MQDWNPQLYRQFESERTRPAYELLARVTTPEVRFATDLGCGPGNSTELLAQAWPEAVVCGIDSSEAMLVQARERLPDCLFKLADIRSWQAEQPQQVIYANASLQWLGDHSSLLPHLVSQLAIGGSLAIQMPDNLEEPSHRLMREVAAGERWRSHISQQAAERKRLLTSQQYYDLLSDAGCEVDLWRTTYYHVMADAQAIITWLRATGLRPFLAGLDENQQQAFLAEYHQALITAYPTRADGKVLLAFPRLFIVAMKTR
ncbi:trans-aconitate 2-methyltransferase [Erwiniaceae bacterium L1_54_6]|jgi:trans-aconitate 2-methyltransferase|uniref:Trans-aconitate 2-methyltransferase n=1 Tax=Pantoea cypripedii TaxID=55209 RepID=A0A6B9GCJ6_PANCY|nr:trans-aconitate 2-methyltransferase [Pantoea cypripedii]MDF7662868.1 trans-aconitate 2-methyltransferase [Erwiniaceae bacterium L1_54_6]QGY30306.1 trans-aconitate 2-methyltransferase [Pantoea cypripedii]